MHYYFHKNYDKFYMNKPVMCSNFAFQKHDQLVHLNYCKFKKCITKNKINYYFNRHKHKV